MFSPQAIQNSREASGTATNGVATATCTASAQERSFVTGFIASYDAAVASIKTITVTYTPEGGVQRTIVIDWNFANGPCVMPLPGVVHGAYDNDPTVALAAGGIGILGRIYAFYMVG